MAHYIAYIDGKPGFYGASLPDAPGCAAMGATFDEVMENTIEALREWMADRQADGLEPPRARSECELSQDPESGWGSAAIAIVPLLLDSGRSVRANISVDEWLLKAIDEAAKERGLTRSAFLASAAREKIVARR